MEFESPWAFALLLLVPLVWWASRRRRGRAAVTFSSSSLVAGLPVGWRARAVVLLPVLRAVALTLLVVALARPRHGVGRVETTADAVAMQIVVDRSGSMRLEMEDAGGTSTRLDVVKRVLREFMLGNEKEGGQLKGRAQDLVGMVTFARTAETVCPLVRDPATLVELAETVRPVTERAEDGTAIGDGLALAAARLRHADEDLARLSPGATGARVKSKVIVLFTDGENNAGERTPQEAAQLAAEWGIKIYAIGIGGPAYQTIETPFGSQRMQVSSGVDSRVLRGVAEATGGVFREAGDSGALRSVYEEIDRLEKTSVESVAYTDYDERFTAFAAAGAAALALELALATLVLRRAP
jgi:Ca-activated chloride channel family protein